MIKDDSSGEACILVALINLASFDAYIFWRYMRYVLQEYLATKKNSNSDSGDNFVRI